MASQTGEVLRAVDLSLSTNWWGHTATFLCPPGVHKVRVSLYKTEQDNRAEELPIVYFDNVELLELY